MAERNCMRSKERFDHTFWLRQRKEPGPVPGRKTRLVMRLPAPENRRPLASRGGATPFSSACGRVIRNWPAGISITTRPTPSETRAAANV
ncbi:hypothetical protein SCANM63S_03208 [Streptomyces canarius]